MRRFSTTRVVRYSLLGAIVVVVLHIIRLPDPASNPRLRNAQKDESPSRDVPIENVLPRVIPLGNERPKEVDKQPDPALRLKRKRKTPFYRWSSRVHAFYYPWYASPSVDGKYLHWNHRRLAPWRQDKVKGFHPGAHQPPDDIAANYYPALGPYSSRNRTVVQAHMEQFRQAGIGVAVVSWYPPERADPNGEPSDDIIPLLLDSAQRYGVQIAFHLEPYEKRDAVEVRKSLRYIVERYGSHPAFYRIKWKPNQGEKPLVYVYDSYQTDANAWAQLLSPSGDLTIRDSKYDCYMLGLLLDIKDLQDMRRAHFDGFYTYFASRGFTFGSEWHKWPDLREAANREGMMFVPSVGPGYDDTAVRPWNEENTHERQGGSYYRNALSAAVTLQPPVISITSFNEWGEGTQIEPAIPFQAAGRRYFDYSPLSQDGYLDITRDEIKHFKPD